MCQIRDHPSEITLTHGDEWGETGLNFNQHWEWHRYKLLVLQGRSRCRVRLRSWGIRKVAQRRGYLDRVLKHKQKFSRQEGLPGRGQIRMGWIQRKQGRQDLIPRRMRFGAKVSRDHWEQRTFSFNSFQNLRPCPAVLSPQPRLAQSCPVLPSPVFLGPALSNSSTPAQFCSELPNPA